MFIAMPKTYYVLPLPFSASDTLYFGQSKGQVRRMLIQSDENPDDYNIVEVKDSITEN